MLIRMIQCLALSWSHVRHRTLDLLVCHTCLSLHSCGFLALLFGLGFVFGFLSVLERLVDCALGDEVSIVLGVVGAEGVDVANVFALLVAGGPLLDHDLLPIQLRLQTLLLLFLFLLFFLLLFYLLRVFNLLIHLLLKVRIGAAYEFKCL